VQNGRVGWKEEGAHTLAKTRGTATCNFWAPKKGFAPETSERKNKNNGGEGGKRRGGSRRTRGGAKNFEKKKIEKQFRKAGNKGKQPTLHDAFTEKKNKKKKKKTDIAI